MTLSHDIDILKLIVMTAFAFSANPPRELNSLFSISLTPDGASMFSNPTDFA